MNNKKFQEKILSISTKMIPPKKKVMKKKEILESIEEMVDEMVKYGDVPYAIICNKKTFRIIAKEIRKLGRFREFDNIIPQLMWFKYEFGDLSVIIYKYCPKDIAYVVNKDTYKRIMTEGIE